jgi:hypothetical protein
MVQEAKSPVKKSRPNIYDVKFLAIPVFIKTYRTILCLLFYMGVKLGHSQ